MTTSYLDWEPEMSLDDVFKSGDSLRRTYFSVDKNNIYWLESRADGSGKIMTMTLDGANQVTPTEYDVRSRVHEYGGRSFIVKQDKIYFSNYSDGRLYVQDLNSDEVQPLTPEINSDGTVGRYVAPIVSPNGEFLIFVYEKASDEHENPNYIGILDLSHSEPKEPDLLITGSDFYGAPIISEDGTIAWIQWSIPNMPFEETKLCIAKLNQETGKLEEQPQVLVDQSKASMLCPRFVNSKLYVIADFGGFEEEDYQNWFNIYQVDLETGKLEPITRTTDREYGTPQWVVGLQRLSATKSDELVAQFYSKGKMKLVIIDPSNLSERILDLDEFNELNNFITFNNSIIVEAGSYRKSEHLRKINLDTFEHELFYELEKDIPEFSISKPKFKEFPTENNETAYCYFYLPKNQNYEPQENEKPPCLVKVHGGPTSRTGPRFNINKQYFTSQGFAILDIDHRGSTGYGRKFRDKMEEQWGVIEMEDVKKAVEYFQEEGVISDFVTISGGSAGGYAVQRALTLYPDLFTAGASYFGIGNLFTLFEMAENHHKFEYYYGVYLFGGMPKEANEVYKERSPIFSIEKLRTPMIILQGEDDRVVHPENSREIAKILDERGIKHKYIEYKGEGHGFRKLENLKDSLEQEINFYKEVFKDKLTNSN